MTSHGRSVSNRLLLAYSLPNLSISVVQLPVGIYLNDLYTTVLGVPLGLVGLAIFLSRVTDVITDPIIGSLSDNWHNRIGRRKFWVLVGTPLMIAALWLLFVPPKGVGAWYLFLMVSLVFLANTMIDLPYRAWGADLSKNYSERSRITAWREAFGLGGNLLAVGVPFVMAAFFGLRLITDWTWGIALMTALLMPLLVLPALLFVPEPAREETGRTKVDWWNGLRVVWRNGAFRRLAVMGLIFVTAIGTTTATSLYYVDHIMGARRIYPTVLLFYFLSSIVAIPVWAMIARRVGKHRATAYAILWLSVWSAPIPLLDHTQFPIFVALMLLKGSAIGALLFLPVSMAADVVDLDTLRAGRARTGLYFALWGMVGKFAAGLAGLMAGLVGVLGFDSAAASPGRIAAQLGSVAAQAVRAANPGVPADQLAPLIAQEVARATSPDVVAAALAAAPAANSEFALLMLACFYSVIPAAFALLALPAMWTYPITEDRQRRLRARIERRNAAIPAATQTGEIGG